MKKKKKKKSNFFLKTRNFFGQKRAKKGKQVVVFRKNYL